MTISQIGAPKPETRLERGVSAWLASLRAYLGLILVGNLLWEILHLPLYTLWRTGTESEQAFAVVHCTLGDLLIALSALTLALIIVGRSTWPEDRFWPVTALAIAFGVGYTIFSEWLNVTVRASWAYSELMPVFSFGSLQIGVSPLMQWIVVPLTAFLLTRRLANRTEVGATSTEVSQHVKNSPD